ncbi:MAG: hypothetical protein ACK4RK_13210 [Gemmataceae bacterium]
MRRFLGGMVILAAAVSPLGAQVTSGPTVGDPVAPLKVHAVVGPVTDKEVDYTAERQDKPTLYLFIAKDKWDRPIARFLKELDQNAPKDSDDVLLVVVWLTDTPDNTKNYLPVAQQALQLQHAALTYFHGDDFSPQDWGINDMAHLTVVVGHKKKVTSVFGYLSVNETDVADVRKALRQAIGKE